jgi:microsomal dipeptidase-like Zn-dependent dipeptidase
VVLEQFVKNSNLPIKKCQYCNRYFIPKIRQDEIYCDLPNEDGKSCREKGAKQTYKQNLERFVDHIEYIISLVGVRHVALGFDFCEYLYADKKEEEINPQGLENASKAMAVIDELYRRGYSESDIRKIAFENFMRVIETILKD